MAFSSFGSSTEEWENGDNLLPADVRLMRARGDARAGATSREGQFMSIESVRGFFAARAPDVAVMEAAGSTATVALAAAAYGVAPAQIAKTLSLRVGEAVFLLVTGGSARLHNGKAKAAFGGKTRMLPPHEVEALTGHPDRKSTRLNSSHVS